MLQTRAVGSNNTGTRKKKKKEEEEEEEEEEEAEAKGEDKEDWFRMNRMGIWASLHGWNSRSG